MKDLKRRVFQTLVFLSAGAMSAGCSSSKGSDGTGGSSATGGKGGSAGGGGGAAGAGRMCGSAADAGGVCAAAPCDGVIAADFSALDAGEVPYGLTTWSGLIKPTYTTDNGTLNITTDVVPGAAPQYVGATLYFLNCLDASAFTGVQFTISGSISSSCQLVFGANDVEHDDTSSDKKGTCDAGTKCYAPNMAVQMAVTSTPTEIKIPWITGSSVPDVPLDTSQLVGVQWQFTVSAAMDGGTPTDCTADLHITGVKFYH